MAHNTQVAVRAPRDDSIAGDAADSIVTCTGGRALHAHVEPALR